MTSGVYIRTEEHKRIIRKNHKGMQGKCHSEKTKAKMRIVHKGHPVSEMTKRKISKSRSGVPVSNKSRERYGIASKKRWSNPEYKERVLRAIAKSCANLPTNPEKKLRRRLNKLFPNEYRFVGDGSFWVGGKNPDFINVNGQKKIIEMFGDYWHSFEKTRRTKKQEERRRIKHFAEFGFKTLVIWQYELKDTKRLREKLREFHIM